MRIIHHHFETIDSTNTWAKNHMGEFPSDALTLVTAHTQTAGRGRFQRRWESPPGQNIYASFCFHVEKQRQDIGNIPQIMSLSAASVLEALKFQPWIKWPNDVLLSSKKIAGILTETTPLEKTTGVIVGIGLNVNMTQEILEKIDQPATSLLAEAHTAFDVKAVLQLLQDQFLSDLSLFLQQGMPPFLDKYRKLIFTYPKQLIRFHDNQQLWLGTFDHINDDGSLTLKLTNGSLKTFIVGEIVPV